MGEYTEIHKNKNYETMRSTFPNRITFVLEKKNKTAKIVFSFWGNLFFGHLHFGLNWIWHEHDIVLYSYGCSVASQISFCSRGFFFWR